MNFLFIIFSLATVVCCHEYYDEEGEEVFTGLDMTEDSPNWVKYLIKSSTGIPFRVEKESTVIYDCSVGFSKQGIINLADRSHPDGTKILIVQNCKNMTAILDLDGRIIQIISLIIRKNEVVTLKFNRNSDYFSSVRNVYVTDVREFEIESVQWNAAIGRASLIMENVTMKSFPRSLSGFSEILFRRVEIGRVDSNAISLRGNSSLTITESHIENVCSAAFHCNVFRANISNNQFGHLENDSFAITAKESFIFSGNRVKNMVTPFTVKASKVMFIENTIEVAEGDWLMPIIISPGTQEEVTVLNVSGNTMNVLPNSLEINPMGMPDFIVLNNNRLRCSCKNWQWFTDSNRNVLSRILFKQASGNVCYNYDNCDLSKVGSRVHELCDGSFVCDGKQKTESFRDRLEAFRSAFENMAADLEHLLKKYHSQELIEGKFEEAKTLTTQAPE